MAMACLAFTPNLCISRKGLKFPTSNPWLSQRAEKDPLAASSLEPAKG